MRSIRILSVFWHNVESDSFSTGRAHPSAHLFRKHIKFLNECYIPISLVDFLRIRQDKRLIRSYDKPPVLLGFDDGFKNVIRYGLPILEEFKTPVVFFVIGEILRNPQFVPWYVEIRHLLRKTKRNVIVFGNRTINLAVQQDINHFWRFFAASFRTCKSDAERQMLLRNFAAMLGVDRPKGDDLDEDQKFVDGRDLANITSSLLTVASHAMTHRDLATLPYEEQVDELEQSDSLLRKQCPSYYPVIAYPNGSFNADTIGIANRVYEAGFASFLRSSYRNIYAYPRVCIGHDSVREFAYAISPKRLNYILPIKRLLHTIRIRPA
jgi:peptidoglycan/xylan/chitin deacetylase (PgdA/CDA1 family)